ncbi:sodium:calcium exchanger [Flavobacteriaceae bacterium TP-CH-4]|uniref:Sodium:calcium exchanger n=1 Tax=Pelagihabitans pacificus TaxID=2696054 RepID=A0A967AX94_9FLAO|nr:Calx-beta domain-containing protein [Pelagihabitans pacificus]NHF61597.1 sodium:calcium exchanger [Pelagihabitans pacificus]
MNQAGPQKIVFVVIAVLLNALAYGQETYLDTFGSVSYAQNDGSANFSSNWIEVNETTSPSSGRIYITGNQLRFENLDNVWIYRDIDLNNATSASLTFDWNATARGDEALYAYLYNNSSSAWEVIAIINSSTTGSVSYNLSAGQMSSVSGIAFGTASGNWNNNERITIDNVQFTATFSPILSISDVTVNEDDGVANFTVIHTNGDASGAFTVDYVSADVTATAGSDYTAVSGTLNFNGSSGDTEQITVSLLDDSWFENNETFRISFTGSSDPSVILTDVGTGTIIDDEIILYDVPLTLFRELNGNYNYTTVGGTFRTNSNGTDPCSIAATSSSNLNITVPAGATISRAYLFWSHSNYSPDQSITFEGQNVDAELVYGASPNIPGYNLRFYGYFAEVTSIIEGITTPFSNTYNLEDLTINNTGDFCTTATVLGAWSLMIFYEESSLPASTINLYYGFDETQNNGTSFTLDSFYAISPAGSKATFLSYEGDATLDGSSSGSTNPEELSITNQGGTNYILSGDGGQTGNNAYNSTYYDAIEGINNTGVYGLDLDTYDISTYISSSDSQVTANVDVGQDLVISSAVVIRVPSNLISGTVFEDVNYPGGAGRNQTTSAGLGVEGVTVELYDALGILSSTTVTDTNGDYSFGGMADGTYTVRVLNQTVTSNRSGGSTCGSCYPVQTFRTSYNGVAVLEVTNEVGGANPAATGDVGAGTLAAAQTASNIVIAGGGIGNIDFGFNFNTIVNTNEDGQGSLEQFIVNANALTETGMDIEANSIFDPIGGVDVSVFMIPPTGDPLGRTADSNYSGGYFDVFIPNVNPLTPITDNNTQIDGRTQTAYSGDTNPGTVGSGGTAVGTSGTLLPNYERPEIQVHRNAGDVFRSQGNNTVIRNLSVYANNNAGVRVDDGSITISNNLLGVNALGANAGNIDDGVEITDGIVIVDGNYIATNTDTGILVNGGTATTIQNNHITTNGSDACEDNITIQSGSGVVIQQNLIENASALGIDGDGILGNLTIYENSITTSGRNGGVCGGIIENAGIRLDGSNSSITNNIIFSNGGAGLVLAGGNTSGNLISQNSFYSNGTASAALGIDLDLSDGLGDGVTLNDSGDTDNGPNGAINFPVISAANGTGTTLVVEGWSRPGAIIELFLTDINEGSAVAGDNELGFSTDYGEGQVYLASFVEGSGADLASGTSGYTDLDGNTDNTNKFKFSVALPPGVSLGEYVTATATVANSTSEFSPFSIIEAYTVITNRRVTYRVNGD